MSQPPPGGVAPPAADGRVGTVIAGLVFVACASVFGLRSAVPTF